MDKATPGYRGLQALRNKAVKEAKTSWLTHQRRVSAEHHIIFLSALQQALCLRKLLCGLSVLFIQVWSVLTSATRFPHTRTRNLAHFRALLPVSGFYPQTSSLPKLEEMLTNWGEIYLRLQRGSFCLPLLHNSNQAPSFIQLENLTQSRDVMVHSGIEDLI